MKSSKKLLTGLSVAILSYCSVNGQTYLPLTGGTLTGNLTVNSGYQIQAPYYGLNAGSAQPANSGNVAIFPNTSTYTMDIVGWSNGWHFVPSTNTSYPAPVVSIDQNGNITTKSALNIASNQFGQQIKMTDVTGGSTVWWMGLTDASGSYFSLGDGGSNSNRLVVQKGTGYVGLGTGLTPLGAQLEIYNNAANYPPLRFTNTGSGNKQWHLTGVGNDFSIAETGVATRATFQAGGNVGIGTASPATLLEVKSPIDAFSTGTQYVGALDIGWDNDFGAGNPAQWLLLTPYLSTGGGSPASGLNGTLTLYRGNTTSYNFNADYHINIQSAYSNTLANMVPLGANSPVVQLYTVTYNNQLYVAVSPQDICGSATNISFFGYYWNNFTSPLKPQLILKTQATTSAVLQNYQSIASNTMYLTSTGNIGIGTTTPQSKFQVNGAIMVGQGAGQGTASFGQLLISDGTSGTAMIGGNHTDNNNVGLSFNVLKASVQQNAITILSTGNVLLGKTSQANSSYILDVNGNVRANQLVINTTGADFVFEPGYKLTTLEKVSEYIKQNRHLPGIETADAMQKNGLDLGDNQAKLLQKIEELTLYMIEMKEENEHLKARIEKLEKKK